MCWKFEHTFDEWENRKLYWSCKNSACIWLKFSCWNQNCCWLYNNSSPFFFVFSKLSLSNLEQNIPIKQQSENLYIILYLFGSKKKSLKYMTYMLANTHLILYFLGYQHCTIPQLVQLFWHVLALKIYLRILVPS